MLKFFISLVPTTLVNKFLNVSHKSKHATLVSWYRYRARAAALLPYETAAQQSRAVAVPISNALI
jgi:hypothetical protein